MCEMKIVSTSGLKPLPLISRAPYFVTSAVLDSLFDSGNYIWYMFLFRDVLKLMKVAYIILFHSHTYVYVYAKWKFCLKTGTSYAYQLFDVAFTQRRAFSSHSDL